MEVEKIEGCAYGAAKSVVEKTRGSSEMQRVWGCTPRRRGPVPAHGCLAEPVGLQRVRCCTPRRRGLVLGHGCLSGPVELQASRKNAVADV